MTAKHSWLPAIFLVLLLQGEMAWSKNNPQSVQIADAYIDIHRGPGRGFPIFYVVERGEHVDIILRQTDWFKITTPEGKTGWAHRKQLEKTLDGTGEKIRFIDLVFQDFEKRRLEQGILGGDFGGARILTAYGGYAFTPNITTELALSQILGNFSDGFLLNLKVVGEPFPHWRYSPYLALGTGIIRTEPSSTIVQTEDRTDETMLVGIGTRIYLTQRYFLRVEYNNHQVLTSRDENEEIHEWKLGFSTFY